MERPEQIVRGETVVESPCVGLFGCCTPGGLSDYVLAAIAGGHGDDGLMQRLQVTVWPDSPKEYRHVDQWPDSQARQMLAEVFERLADLEPSKFAILDKFDDGGIPNLRSQFMRILAAAGVAPWPKLFVNLRSTRRTELQESFPDHVVNKWLGHSGKVAEKHYLQVTDEHWGKAIEFRTPTGSPIGTPTGTIKGNRETTKPNELQGSDGVWGGSDDPDNRPSRARTYDLRIRNPLLYPAEL